MHGTMSFQTATEMADKSSVTVEGVRIYSRNWTKINILEKNESLDL